MRLVSDVPLGAFLSGGVDSSAIVASMSSLSSDPVNCFSVEFGVRGFDETAYAREVAERFHARHVVDRVDPADLLSLDGLISTYDEPFGDSSALPTSRVCAAARRHVTVALSGDGGDEQFAGYRRYKWHVAEERVRGLLPNAFRQKLFTTLASLYPNLGWAPRPLRAKHTFEELAQSPADAFFHSVAVTSDSMRRRIFSERLVRELQGYDAKSVIRQHMAMANTDDPLAQALYTDIKTWLPGDILTKVDRASMAQLARGPGAVFGPQVHGMGGNAAVRTQTAPGDGQVYFETCARATPPTRDPLSPQARIFYAIIPVVSRSTSNKASQRR